MGKRFLWRKRNCAGIPDTHSTAHGEEARIACHQPAHEIAIKAAIRIAARLDVIHERGSNLLISAIEPCASSGFCFIN
jgi:hypothetical protein